MSDTELEIRQEESDTQQVRYVDLVAAKNKKEEKDEKRPSKKVKTQPNRNFLMQTYYILKMIFIGKARKAVHFSVSDAGGKCWMLLLPIQLMLPAALAVCCSKMFSCAVLGGELLLRVFLLWIEQLIILLLVMRLLSAITKVGMNGASVCGLVFTAMTPMTVGSLIAAVVSVVWTPLAGAILVVSAMLFVILLYMGFEFVCISTKTRSFGWFIAAMLVWFTPTCIMAQQLINFI